MKRRLFLNLSIFLIVVYILFFTIAVNAEEEKIPWYGKDGEYITYRNSSEYITLPTTFNFKEQEMRAAWISAFAGDISNFTSADKFKNELTNDLDILEYYNFNTIIFHVRTHNNALYQSDLNPLATFFSKVNFSEFDPLEWLIDECHKRGMEFHAWLNPYRVKIGTRNYAAEDYPASNPASDPSNLLYGKSGSNTYVLLNPGKEAVKQFLVDTCMEIIERYDVDAIHFDDYFYANGIDDSQTFVENNPNNLDLADWRRSNVNDFIERLGKTMRNYNIHNNRCVQLGIAPSGVYRDGDGIVTYDEKGNAISKGSNTGVGGHYGGYLYADTLRWVNNEWIDYIMPQIYHDFKKKINGFAEVVDWWNAVVKYKKVNLYIGIGFYGPDGNWDDPKELRNQIYYMNKKENVRGYAIYKFSTLKSAYLNSNALKHTQVEPVYDVSWSKVCYPQVVRTYSYNVGSVNDLKIKKTTNGYELSFEKNNQARLYIVYRNEKNRTDLNSIIDITAGKEKNGRIYINDEIDFDTKYYYSIVPLSLSNKMGKEASVNTRDVSYKVEFFDTEGNRLAYGYSVKGVVSEPHIKVPDGKVMEYSQPLDNITEDTKIIVTFKDVSCISHFKYIDENGEEIVKDVAHLIGEKPEAPNVPLRAGYEFKGFVLESEGVYIAQYEKIKFKVEFVDISNKVIETKYFEYGDTISEYPMLDEVLGYSFVKWDYEGVVKSNLTIKPIYEKESEVKVKVTFVNSLGVILKVFEVKPGEKIEMIEVKDFTSNDGIKYQFKGFYINDEKISAEVVIVNLDTTIVAKMEQVVDTKKQNGCKMMSWYVLSMIGLCGLILRKRRIK